MFDCKYVSFRYFCTKFKCDGFEIANICTCTMYSIKKTRLEILSRQNLIEGVGLEEKVILISDINGQIGERLEGVIGRYEVLFGRDNVKTLHGLCASVGMIIIDAYLQHKDAHRYTYYSYIGDLVIKDMNDMLMVRVNVISSVHDSKIEDMNEKYGQ